MNKFMKRITKSIIAGTMIMAMSVSAFAADTGGAAVNNTAGIVSENGSSVDINSNTVSTKVIKPVLNISKTADKDNARPGESITYTITVSNTGDAEAKNVTLSDTFDTGKVTLTSVKTVTGVTNSTSGNAINWTVASILPDSETVLQYTVKVNDNTAGGTEITPTAPTISGEDSKEIDPITPDPDEQKPVEVVVPVLMAVKNVDKTEARSGETLTYTIDITNNGTTAGKNIKVEDSVDTSLVTIDESSISSSDNITCTVNNGTIGWNIANLAAGAKAALTFKVTIK